MVGYITSFFQSNYVEPGYSQYPQARAPDGSLVPVDHDNTDTVFKGEDTHVDDRSVVSTPDNPISKIKKWEERTMGLRQNVWYTQEGYNLRLSWKAIKSFDYEKHGFKKIKCTTSHCDFFLVDPKNNKDVDFAEQWSKDPSNQTGCVIL